MTKIAIAQTVSGKLNITQQEAKQVVQNVLDAIKDTLVEESRIELRNFGVLEVRERAARKARNPRTGDTVQVEKKRVPLHVMQVGNPLPLHAVHIVLMFAGPDSPEPRHTAHAISKTPLPLQRPQEPEIAG